MKKVCILMTSYNPSVYLLEQLESVFAQKNVEIDVILRDDCSPDKTYLEQAKEKYKITVIEGEINLGVAGNIEKLFDYAIERGAEYDYFAYADQDDVWMADKMEVACRALDGFDQSKPALYYSNLLVVDKDLNPSHELFRRGIVRNTVGQSLTQVFLFACTAVFNFEMVKSLKGMNFSAIGFDSCLYYKGILSGQCTYDDVPHIQYRQHGNNVSGVKKKGKGYLFGKIKSMKRMLKDRVFKKNAKFVLENFTFPDDESKHLFEMVANYKSLWSRLKIIFHSKIKAGYYPKNVYGTIRLLLNAY